MTSKKYVFFYKWEMAKLSFQNIAVPEHKHTKIRLTFPMLLFLMNKKRAGSEGRTERRIAKNYKAKFLSTKYCWLKLVMNVKLVFLFSWVKLVFVEVRLG